MITLMLFDPCKNHDHRRILTKIDMGLKCLCIPYGMFTVFILSALLRSFKASNKNRVSVIIEVIWELKE